MKQNTPGDWVANTRGIRIRDKIFIEMDERFEWPDSNAEIKGNKFYFGSIKNDRLWSLDDPEVIKVVVNLIKYAMIRDEYRDYVKKSKG